MAPSSPPQLAQRPLRAPPITYGKQRTKPIPLKGTHFLRQETSSSPPPPVRKHLEAVGLSMTSRKFHHVVPRRKSRVRRPDPEDSPLSEDELDAVHGDDASPFESPPSSETSEERGSGLFGRAWKPFDFSQKAAKPVKPPKRAERPLIDSSAASNIVVKPKSILKTKPSSPKERRGPRRIVQPVQWELPPAPPARVRRQIIQSIEETSAAPEIIEKPKVQQPRPKPAKPSRPRIPDPYELALVHSPTQSYSQEPDPDYAGVQTQDPITDSSQRKGQRVSPISDDDGPRKPRVPLTSLRKQIKTPKFTHKSVVKLRKKHESRNRHFFKKPPADRNLGDGFETSELRVNRAVTVARKRGRPPKLPVVRFGALNLKAGPLPDVDFSASSIELKMETHANDQAYDSHTGARYQQSPDCSSAKKLPRRVGFSDKVLDDMTLARLSSVSAPRRAVSISSDEENEDEEETEPDEDETEASPRGDDRSTAKNHDEDTDAEGYDEDDDEHQRIRRRLFSTPTSAERPSRPRVPRQHAQMRCNPPTDTGVTLDFRRSSTLGIGPRKLAGRPHLMEVDEAIDEVPDEQPIVRSTGVEPEPDDMLMLDSELPMNQVESVTRANQSRLFGVDPRETPAPQRRPRSILRNPSYHAFQEVDARPERTAANTRRNSRVPQDESRFFNKTSSPRSEQEPSTSPEQDISIYARGRTEIQLDNKNNRYFTSAAGMLNHSDIQSKPRVIKSRTSDRRRSSYFNEPAPLEKDILIPNSDAPDDFVPETSTAVRETSPDPVDYTNFIRRQEVLKRNSDTEWTSSLPKVPKDLRSLTRKVSMEHGTLSQSMRRRTSMPFQRVGRVG